MGSWSDLASDLLISITIRLADAGDYARFRAVCTSWESAVRGFRPPSFFPWLAVIPDNRNPNKNELSFISHAANDGVYKRAMPCDNIDFYFSYMSGSNKDGWIMFVCHDSYEAIIVNPVTGAQLHHLPSLCTTLKDQLDKVFLADTLAAFAVCHDDYRHLILATAGPGDDAWSALNLSLSYNFNSIIDIVFHDADRKFYAMDVRGKLLAFRLTRSGRKTAVGEVSTLSKRREGGSFTVIHLVSDGSNLLRVRKGLSRDFEILKYCPDADMWVEMINIHLLGNNSLFFDWYGAKLLPLPQEDGYLLQREGRLRRNCIYFIDYDKIPPQRAKEKEEYGAKEEEEGKYQWVFYARVYDVSKGIVEPCFSTNIRRHFDLSPALMWFTPSLSRTTSNLVVYSSTSVQLASS